MFLDEHIRRYPPPRRGNAAGRQWHPTARSTACPLLKADKRVAVVERELIGGECAYWACIPSKTLLRPPEALGEVDKAAGIGGASLDWPATRDYRDYMIRYLDDSDQVKGYAKRGAKVFKGVATVTAPHTVDVDGESVTAEHVVVATGSDAFVPPIDGLDDVTVCTNREATTLREIPQRALMVGGSAVGVELGQFLARFGTQVTTPNGPTGCCPIVVVPLYIANALGGALLAGVYTLASPRRRHCGCRAKAARATSIDGFFHLRSSCSRRVLFPSPSPLRPCWARRWQRP